MSIADGQSVVPENRVTHETELALQKHEAAVGYPPAVEDARGSVTFIALGALIAGVIWVIPATDLGLSTNAIHGCALVAMLLVWWISSAMPPGLAATFFVVLMVGLNVLPPSKLLATTWTTSTIWFVIATFGIGLAITSTTLGERILRYSAAIVSTGAGAVVLFFIFSNLIFSVIGLAGSFARYALIFPLLIAVSLRKNHGADLARAMALVLITVAPITQLVLLNGVWLNPSVMLLSRHTPLSYFGWLVDFAVPSCAYALVSGYTLFLLMRRNWKYLPETFAELKTKKFATLSLREKKLIGYVVLVVLLWLTAPWTHLDPGWAALFVVCLMCMPKFGVISFDEFLGGVKWSIVLFISGAFALGSAVDNLGLIDRVSPLIERLIFPTNAYLLGMETVVYTIAIHIFLGETAPTMAVVIPIFSHSAIQHGFSGFLFGWIAYATTFVQAFFLYQQSAVVFAYAFGLFRLRDVMAIGCVQAACLILVLGIGSVAWWQIIDVLRIH